MNARTLCGLVVLGLMTGCEQREKAPDPQTPEEMYARVRELLQPNVEHDASDFENALVWLHRAAEGGHLQAQTDLGGIYLEGGKGGVKPDGARAYHWFSQAAEQGSKEALYYLGLLLHRGMGIAKDEARALAYWRQAAEAGVAEAQLRLGIELAHAEESVSEGVTWLTQAVQARAAKTAAQAACALGNIYATGKHGIPKDMKEAARWYEIAARGGDAAAQLVYAIMLLQGEHVTPNAKQGMSYLRLSAGQDNPRAIALLVNLLRNDSDTDNEQEADAWAQRLETLRLKAQPSATETQNAPE